MQTFLPYADFDKTASVLDNKRLGNQAYRECKSLINGGWPNHPASKMWKGYEYALAKYALALLNELTKRGRHYPHHIEFYKSKLKEYKNTGMPSWLGNKDFHASHRSNLLRKDYQHYSKFGWKEPADLSYVWPITKEK